jgi:hypothetical protein
MMFAAGLASIAGGAFWKSTLISRLGRLRNVTSAPVGL